MNKLLSLSAAMCLLVVVGCSNSEQTANEPIDMLNSGSLERSPDVDTDPTLDTSTGGDSQTASPDATINGAPEAQ